MTQALRSTRPGGFAGIVGVPTVSSWPARSCSTPTCTCTAGRPRCAAFSPSSSTESGTGGSTPGKVFDLTLPLEQAAEGYRAMDQRSAIKTLLRP
jgi:threonine dehydrogenase-like Zn-dependent dehydrogenase